MSTLEVAIIGAGPYGLSAAAHLRKISGLDFQVFGEPMEFWQRQMPRGMFLRSGWEATHISDPDAAFRLEAYESTVSRKISKPVPIEDFVAYGQWFQRQTVPNLDQRRVSLVERNSKGFHIHLSTGEHIKASRVVVATGIAKFAWTPPAFCDAPQELVSHTSAHSDFSGFRGKEVIVVGGGQSALESAALLREAGASVRMLVREPGVHWLAWRHRIANLGFLGRLLYAPSDVGPAGLSQLVARPNAFRLLPRFLQTPLAKRCIRPAGAGWLKQRVEAVEGIQLSFGRSVGSVRPAGERVYLRLDDGSGVSADHVFLGTGYRVDVSQCPFLSDGLRAEIRQVNGYPVLQQGFESAASGLHFVGAPAAWSFGPLMRFVSGTHFVSGSLAQYLQRKKDH